MKLLLLGLPGIGKSTVAPILRRRVKSKVIDIDEEIMARNEGAWPSIERKNKILADIITDIVHDSAILLNSYMPLERAKLLHEAGFVIAELRISEEGLTRRIGRREQEEGWSNAEWLLWHRDNIQTLRNERLIDIEVDAGGSPNQTAVNILKVLGEEPHRAA